MKAFSLYTLPSLGLALAACSAEPNDDKSNSLGQEIVRSTTIGGRNEAVMVYATAVVNGQFVTRPCSGVYFAPRVVLTAAHCLQSIFSNQLFVYYGDDFEQDLNQLTEFAGMLSPPAPGQPSFWAQADSFEAHPQWDPVLLHPDIGVIYLDRKLPFDPLPLARFRLGNSWLGQSVTISGWGANQATGPTTGAGAGVQRTGSSVILGSPTAADYHPEDPNPGMLVPAVRQNVLKIDGRAPNSNGCFGDSGSPLIVNQGGQDYIAGIEYFGGLFCEDYSLYTRIDPFLAFLDAAYFKGGQALLLPHLECVTLNANGSFTAYFGFQNDNGVGVSVPYGSKNALAQDTQGYRPTLFPPGDHHFAFGVDFAAGQTLVYRLSPENSPTTSLRVNSLARRCGPADAIGVECAARCRGLAGAGCPNQQSNTQCADECSQFGELVREFIPQCLAVQTAVNRCFAGTPPGGSNWQCFPESGAAFPLGCEEQQFDYEECLSGG
jgi:hypothetical protein